MSVAVVFTRTRWGLEYPQVTLEVHISNGLPGFTLVGLPDTSVREARERVRSALLSSGLEFPQRRITVNLAPADLPKESARFDLAIAMGILSASGRIERARLESHEFLAELGLSGDLRSTSGVLGAALKAGSQGRTLVVAPADADVATKAPGVRILAPSSLSELVAHFDGFRPLAPCQPAPPTEETAQVPDLADVRGQARARRALEIAAAGGHHLLMIGPPGAGKTLLAERMPGLLPPLDDPEALEVALTESVDRQTRRRGWRTRPWRAPHHTATPAALAGGGSNPRPGEISLAHHGVLFLDEIAEFRRDVLEILRQPLEHGEILISRARQRVHFPSRFQLIAAMNPCACGHPETPPAHCTHPLKCCQQYQSKLSGPLLDRIDLCLHMEPVGHALLEPCTSAPEDSRTVRTRVIAARTRQKGRSERLNAHYTARDIDAHCPLSVAARSVLVKATQRLSLSARTAHRVIKVARTLADLEQQENIGEDHLCEALSYRL